jgi:hypothetical protein
MAFLPQRQLDCLCGALAVNCCQFPCCIPKHHHVCPIDADSDADTSNWMQKLQDLHPGVLLRDLVLVGTHDAASYTISAMQPFSAIGRTQQLNVLEQLEAGARYVDLRVAGTKGSTAANLVIQHGCLRGGSLRTVVDHIQSFLQNHKGEFVVLEVTPEYGQSFTDGDKRACLSLLHEAFDEMLLRVDALMEAIRSKTIKQVVQEDHCRLAVLLHQRFYSDRDATDDLTEASIQSRFGFGNSGRFMHNKWHNTRSVDQLLESNLEEVRKHGTDQNKWLNSQLILTPGVDGALEIFKALIGRNPLRPVSWALRLYNDNKLGNYFREHSAEPWNVIVLDYLDLCPTVVDFIIALNFCAKLQIEAAVVTNHKQKENVTDKIQTWVQRDRVLWLTHVMKDLELSFAKGDLTIAYSLGVEETATTYHVLYLGHWNAKSPVLVSQFASNTHDTTKTQIEPSTQKGYVTKGRVSSEREESCVVSFQWDLANCNFTVEE